ncbi:hypothetical protein D3C83_134560 [compost metagenome]
MTTAPEADVASAMMSAGTVSTGGGADRSTTVMVNVFVSEPVKFVAVQVTIVIPAGNTLPEGRHSIVASFVAVTV